jgi:hypothetical protein
MKPLKFGLRVWITLTSVLSFLAGWMLFAHAGKPAPLIATQLVPADSSNVSNATNTLNPLPTLQPLPSLNDLTTNSATQLQSLPSFQNNPPASFFPSFRSRGS